MKFSLITGPGNHAHFLIRALQQYHNFSYSEYWPKYRYVPARSGTPESNKFFDFASYILYGLHNRVKLNKNNKWHQDLLFSLYDSINTKKLDVNNLIAWPQVSLQAMRKVKELHGKTILEQPMCHVDFWNTVAQSEHGKLSIHDTISFSRFMANRMKQEYDLADQIVVHSNFSKRTFLDYGLPENKIKVCSLGIDLPERKTLQKHFAKKLQILYVGRVEVLKGIHYLLEATELFANHVEVHLVGSIQNNYMPVLRTEKGNIKFYGHVARQQLEQLYRQADLFIFPSLYDGFGLAIIEAMSYGVPVVATEHSGAPDIITDKVDGFIIKPYSVRHIAETIEMVLRDRELLRTIGLAAQDKVYKQYSFEMYSMRINQLVNSMLF